MALRIGKRGKVERRKGGRKGGRKGEKVVVVK
jgi:hypothetical protein